MVRPHPNIHGRVGLRAPQARASHPGLRNYEFDGPMNLTTAATIATAVISTILAALVALITWRQWVTNRARLRHELFDRRYAIYEQVAGFLAEVFSRGAVEPGAASNFLRQTKRAYFAFGCDIAVKQLVEEIYKQAILLQMLKEKESVLPPGDDLIRNIEKRGEILQWFNTTLSSLEPHFAKYLRLEH